MPGGEIQKILKIFKVQTGSNNSRWLLLKKISKLKLKYGWIKFRKSKSNLSLDWLWYFQSFLENIIEHTVGYTLGFEKKISTQIKFHVQMYKYLNSNSDSMCKCTSSNTNSIKFYMQAMYHLQFKMAEGSNLWHMKTFDHVTGSMKWSFYEWLG